MDPGTRLPAVAEMLRAPEEAVDNRVMDVGVNLVESYLRLNGYFTLSEFEVQRRTKKGRYKSVTDIDIMAIRMPGNVYVGDPHKQADRDMMLINDPVLMLEQDCVDVIIGEVKQGAADFNRGIRDHGVLHSLLRRVQWLYDEPVDIVIDGLQHESVCHAKARGNNGGAVRTRLVAFGKSAVNDLHTISLRHVVSAMLGFFETHEEAFRPIQFRDPATALLRLLLKAGFDVNENGS